MGVTWTARHFFFGLVLRKRGPRGLEVRDEVPLSKEPPRLDYLLLHRHDPSSDSDPPVAEDGGPCTLQRLWPLLSRVAVVEYKSPTHPYRSGQLDRLWGYVHIYFANQWAAAGDRSTDVRQSVPRDVRQSVPRDVRQSLPREELSAVLVVARRTPSLDKDIASMGLSWDDHGGGTGASAEVSSPCTWWSSTSQDRPTATTCYTRSAMASRPRRQPAGSGWSSQAPRRLG